MSLEFFKFYVDSVTALCESNHNCCTVLHHYVFICTYIWASLRAYSSYLGPSTAGVTRWPSDKYCRECFLTRLKEITAGLGSALPSTVHAVCKQTCRPKQHSVAYICYTKKALAGCQIWGLGRNPRSPYIKCIYVKL